MLSLLDLLVVVAAADIGVPMAFGALITYSALLTMPARVHSATCTAHKTLEVFRCATSASTSCNDAACCEYGANSCSRAPIGSCASNQYWDSTKNGSTTSACCTANARCTSYTCKPGYKAKASVSSILCAGAATSCNPSRCCDLDTLLCGGVPVICANTSTHYKDSSKDGTPHGGTSGTTCCSARATCSSRACPAGYKAKASSSSIICSGATSTCIESICCDVIVGTCANFAGGSCTYGPNYHWDSAKGGTVPSANTSFQRGIDCCSLKATCGNYICKTPGMDLKVSRCSTDAASCTDSGCCEWREMATCTSAYTCASGYKHKANASSIYCAATSCTSNGCCEPNPDLCGGVSVTCAAPSTHYVDSAKDGTPHGGTSGTTCCTLKANCGSHACAAGYKAKANATSIICNGATCTKPICCDPNPDLCGGVPVTCAAPSTHYVDSAKKGTAHNGTLGTTCCSAKANCSSHTCAAGYMAKANPSSIICNGTTCTKPICCDPRPDLCGGVSVTCAYLSTHYVDSAKDGTPHGGTSGTTCCTAKSSCAIAYATTTTMTTTTTTTAAGSSSSSTGSSTGTQTSSASREPPCYCIIVILFVAVFQSL